MLVIFFAKLPRSLDKTRNNLPPAKNFIYSSSNKVGKDFFPCANAIAGDQTTVRSYSRTLRSNWKSFSFVRCGVCIHSDVRAYSDKFLGRRRTKKKKMYLYKRIQRTRD